MIRSSAPTRIDLAGGTLDIWPLYLFFPTPTLNAAINLYATVELTARKDKKIRVESKDLNLKGEFASLESLPENHALDLILRTLKHYRPRRGLNLATDCRAPRGSGIGGSSALSIALHGALQAFVNKRTAKDRMIQSRQETSKPRSSPFRRVGRIISPLRTAAPWLSSPALSGIAFERVQVDPREMTRRFVLCYSGEPRNSGINNWEVMKKTIDGNAKIRRHLMEIQKIARKMRQAFFTSANLDRIAPLYAEEWKARKALAPGISTPHMNRLFRAAEKSGALAGKVCGAGGGGCIAFIVQKGSKSSVEDALKKQGGNVLDFKFVKPWIESRKPLKETLVSRCLSFGV